MYELIEAGNMDAILRYLMVRIAIVLVCWLFVFIANFVDFWSGRDTAKSLGEKVDSKGYRRTFTKIGDYYRVLIFAFLFDIIASVFPFYKIPVLTMLGSIAVMAIECSSVIENSRKKRSHAADVPLMVKKIVEAANVKQGTEILEQLTAELKKKQEKEY